MSLTSTNVTIVRAVKTCDACPSQWDAWDSDGNYWYLRFRFGHGTAEMQPSNDPDTWVSKEPEVYFSHGDILDGYMDLAEFADCADFILAL